MSSTTPDSGGTATSFTNTPQAKDDTYTYLEDLLKANSTVYNVATNTITLDVMANDLGGGAKSLFSVSDGDGNAITSDFELLYKDVNASGCSPWEETFNHNWVRINNGKIEYRIADGSGIPGQGRSIDTLAGGEAFTDNFVYAIRLGNGTLSQANVTINITGANDGTVITPGGTLNGGVIEDSGTYTASGSFGFTDIDATDTHTVSATPAGSGYLGTLTPTVSDDSTGDGSGTVSWTFNVNNADLQFLGEGETRTQTYTLTVDDGHGSTVTQTVTVVLTGDNDPVVMTGGDVAGAVLEESGAYTDSGSFGFTDVDLIDVHSVSVTPDAGGYLGTLTATKTDDSTGDGAGTVGWSFVVDNAALQFLGEGETRTQTYTVTVNDGQGGAQTQIVTVVLTGDNDPIVITSAAQAESLSEDGTSVSGSITFSDIDLSDTHTASFVANGGNATSLGSFSIDPSVTEAANAATGSLGWSYTVDNAAAQSLAVGDTAVEHYEVTFSDGHGGSVTETVTVTITGANDGPDIRAAVGDSAGAALDETNGGLTASGTLTVTDPDTSDTVDTAAAIFVSGNQGTLSDGDLLAMFSITAGASNLAANSGDANNLSWAFDSGSEAFDFLAAGQVLTLTYTLTSDDGNGGTDTQDVTITITGTNDTPVLTASVTAGTYTDTAGDDSFSDISGTLTTVDPDTGDTAAYSVNGGVGDNSLFGYDLSSSTTYGTLYLNSATGAYTFVPDDGAIEALKTGTSVSFTLTVTDGSGGTDSEILTINLDGANDTPELGAVTDASYTDTSGNDIFGNVTGTLTSTDRDSPESATYGVTGGVASAEFGFDLEVPGDYGTFYLNSLTGDYKFVPDDGAIEGLKTTTSVDFDVSVTDGSGASDGDTLTITLNGVNDTPEAPATNSVTTDEDSASAAVAINATDRDAGEVLTYTVKTGFGPALGSVSFDQLAGTFTYTPAADANGPDSFTILITDASGATTEQVVSVTVNPVNDAPVITSGDGNTASVSVAENTTAVTTVTATDIDSPTITFSISGGADAALFAIDPDTGALSFVAAPNFEAPGDAGGNNVYDVEVTASDGSLTDTQAIAVTVTNVNEAPAITSDGGGDTASVGVAENSTAVTTVTAVDPDAATTLTFSIVGGADAALFEIDSTTGVLTFVSGPDYESPADAGADNVYDVTVRASDGSLHDDQAISVTVTNENDNTPVITSNGGGDSDAISIAENTTAVANVDATDADGDTLTYSISGGADAAKFSIDASTGVLTFIAAPDFENPTDVGGNNVYDVEVTASDGLHSDTQSLAVTITNENDNAPVITSNGGGDSDAISIAENTTAVADVDATDADGDTLTYSIVGGADALKFAIDPNSGVLTFVAAPDYENPTDAGANNVYDVVVQASDGTHVDTQTLAVTVTNQNDNAPVITSNGGGASASITVAENTTAVADVDATDADGDTLTYSIVGGADAAKFAIDPNTGVLTFVAAPDFENPTDAGANNVYDVVVQASDGTHVDTQTLAVTVTNQNDNAPVITSNGGGASASITVAENTSAVADVDATDADGDTLTYSISGGADALKFAIDANTGVLTFIAAPDFENPTDAGANNVYDVEVTASDGTHSDTQSLAVTVTNQNDNAPVIGSNGGNATASVSVPENSTAVTTVTATDADGNPVTFSITGGADAAKFAIDPNSGVLTFIAAPNFEAPTDAGLNNVYDVVVTASDGTNVDTQAIAITVTNVNETPAITSNGGGASASVNVVENTTTVTTVAATDPDAATTITYSIVGGDDAAKFTINPTTGALSFVSAPDFEAPTDAGGDNLYDVVVQASDGSLVDTQAIAVTVTDVADGRVKPTDISLTPATPDGDVNFNNFVFNGTLTATDPDPGAFTFTITSQTGGGAFEIIGGNILTSDDISPSKQFTVIIRATQTGDPTGVFTEETFGIITGSNGNSGEDPFNGLSGDDILFGNAGNDMVFGLAGNDTLFGQDGNDQLTGGAGNDVFALTSANPANIDAILDYAAGDRIDVTSLLSVAAGTDVTGGGFLRVTTTGLVQIDTNGSAAGGQVWITIGTVNTGAGPYAITYLSGGVTTTVNVTPSGPPVALDMDGDGQISFITSNAGATFDYGYGKVATAWVAGNDGLLVRDANGDGQVSATELVFATGGSDLEGLRVYDSNGDGQLSSADAGFADFAVWQDADSDGHVDAGEMQSLTALGIASISLTSDGIGYAAAGGDVQVVGTGSYTRVDGSTGMLADAVFATGAAASSQEQQSKASASANSAVLAVAVAAAGLAASVPAAAANASGEMHAGAHAFDAPLGGGLELSPLAASAVAKLQVAEQMTLSSDHNALAIGDSYRGGADARPFQAQLDGAFIHAGPDALLAATDAPVHQAMVMPFAAPSVSMPSAEQLGALAAAQQDGVQHNQIVGQVLAEALQGGGGPDIDALLNSLPGQPRTLDAPLSGDGSDGLAIAASVMHQAALDHAGISIGVLHPDAAPSA